ncbi:ATP-dependent helicase HrpB [Rhodopirellula sp. JC740]|uniref:ATP-dependent helicase HrpB n=1 Tax=Rhodopirellula halodulae TaxID=2894198 RepID=A0ABS8NN50_9BACT|nr:ATP-dependent helicase HrpB [Rhodopirellula sp. JC740]MCC9644960.1 ATP-dependent helicase HrpB [Rhodopirellula sp. JC740]
MTQLPIDEILPSLKKAIGSGNAVVLKAPPGAGKTTRVPIAILDALEERQIPGQIWVIQPRRLAARSVANWIAHSREENVGETVGYHVRLDRRESARTRIVLMTTGMFLRRMQSDPLLEQAACVVLDEFHERTLELDVAIAMTHRLRSELRDDLRMVVMSATMETAPIADYLNRDDAKNALEMQCEGRTYPVTIHHGDDRPKERLEQRLIEPICNALSTTDGHVLVFLPGVADIHRVQRALQSSQAFESSTPTQIPNIVSLHGSLSPKEQDAAIRTSANRKLILATNIAETSVTVDGVTAVVDSGLAKVPRFDSRRGMTRLETTAISIASADQRSGRAGRTSEGHAYRIWSMAAQRSREEYDVPEILRSDLSGVMLMLASHGEKDLSAIHWLTPPPPHAADSAGDLLKMLGALDFSGRLTQIGSQMAEMPLHPRIARMAIEASQSMSRETVAALAALLSERHPFESCASMSLSEMVHAITHKTIPRNVTASALKSFQRIIESIGRSLPQSIANESLPITSETPSEIAIAKALLAAYPDRVVLRRADTPDRGRMVGGRGVVGLQSVLGEANQSPLVLCWDVDGGGVESKVRSAISIEEDWLDSNQIAERDQQTWDTQKQSVRCRHQTLYGDLVLKETPGKVPGDETTEQLLFENTRSLLPIGGAKFEKRLQRMGLVASVMDEVAPFDDAMHEELLRQLCHGKSSLAELQRAAWFDHFLGLVGYDVWQIVEREAREEIALPGGRRVPIRYEDGKPPWIEVKIQLCFGWRDTPRILGGRVPLQLHLLGPNGRPQQITNDLASFWANTYTEIRKELRRRYPKHDWPENPHDATPTHHGMKRR